MSKRAFVLFQLLCWSFCTVSAIVIRIPDTGKRKAHNKCLKFSLSTVDVTNYVFHWQNGDNSEPLQALLADSQPDDMFYVITGDTQHWYRCTSNNPGCWHATDCNISNNTCKVAHGNYANRAQKVKKRFNKSHLNVFLSDLHCNAYRAL